MVLNSKFTYGSQFPEEKNGLKIRFLVPEILSKYKRSIFFETPCTVLYSGPAQRIEFRTSYVTMTMYHPFLRIVKKIVA